MHYGFKEEKIFVVIYTTSLFRKKLKKKKKIHWFGGFFQEAQDKLWELDRLSNKLDAFVEKTKNATIEETEVRKIDHFITQMNQ